MKTCEYCGRQCLLGDGDMVYPHRKDLKHLKFYLCEPCKAYVGCHRGTETPLGRVANKELRYWKQQAHKAFDPLWERKIERDKCSKKIARSVGYKWLARELGIKYEDCHVGEMDITMCKRVVEICSKYRRR